VLVGGGCGGGGDDAETAAGYWLRWRRRQRVTPVSGFQRLDILNRIEAVNPYLIDTIELFGAHYCAKMWSGGSAVDPSDSAAAHAAAFQHPTPQIILAVGCFHLDAALFMQDTQQRVRVACICGHASRALPGCDCVRVLEAASGS
jgi:hypothetical protein